MDKGLWRVGAEGNDGWSYSPLPGRSVNRSAVAHLRSIDNAADDPAFVVGLFQQDGSNGWSEDWGRTFTALAPPPGQASRSEWRRVGKECVSTGETRVLPDNKKNK